MQVLTAKYMTKRPKGSSLSLSKWEFGESEPRLHRKPRSRCTDPKPSNSNWISSTAHP